MLASTARNKDSVCWTSLSFCLQLNLLDGRIYGLNADRSDTTLHYPRRIPGLPGLYLTGQTTHMAGVNIAAISGLLTADEVIEDSRDAAAF